MDIRLIAFDLDGTLLTGEKRLSKRNREALRCSIERGIHMVPSTGRTVDGIPAEIKEIPGIRYAITLNGAVVVDLAQQKVIAERKMDRETAGRILDMVCEYPLMYDAYIDGRGKSEERFYFHLEDYGISRQIQKLVRETRDLVPDIRRYVRENPGPVEKINLFFKDEDLRRHVRKELSQIPEILVTSSLPNNLEINDAKARKGDALISLAEYLGLSAAQTMAFGDGENDMSMIQRAGFGVAMANGDKALREIADYVTSTNDEDGVALAIQRFVL